LEPASRNAVSLKCDDGSYILRIDDRGTITLFTLALGGTKVSRDQDAEPLAIATATKAKAEDDAATLSKQLKLQSGVVVEIALDAPGLGIDSGAWSAMADAVAIVGVALNEVLADRLGHEAIDEKVKRVVIRDSGQVGIKLVDQTLVVEIATDKPIIGRPSSKLLISTIGDLL
jgi:Domain of unknown function (DUF4908)